MNTFGAVVVVNKCIDDGLMADPMRDIPVIKLVLKADGIIVHHIRVVWLMTNVQWKASVVAQIDDRTSTNKGR